MVRKEETDIFSCIIMNDSRLWGKNNQEKYHGKRGMPAS